MQAASRQSYAAALTQLDAYATTATDEQLSTVSDEVLAVTRLLAAQVRLRRALSDPARPGADRVGLLHRLLGEQIGEHSRQLLDTLVAGRWSAAAELRDGCEQLAVQALLAAAERAGNLAEVEDELFRFGQLVAGDPALAAALSDHRAPVSQRAVLVDSLLSGKATGATVRAAKIALGGFGGRSVEGALIKLVELAAERRDRSVAYVTVATPLSEAEERRLGATLSTRYGRDVSVKTTIDPRVLGGARVQVGADLYDGTVAHRLAQARNALASG
jgi:F-type H+-transporting ATPase subunit delta